MLREVEALLEQGRAVGAKPLREYLEVQGYGDAAQWVYAQALEPGEWHNGELLSIHEVRDIHQRIMEPVWQISPHADAGAREGPGMYREHDIAAFGAGMRPPAVSLVPCRMTDWVDFVRTEGADRLVSTVDESSFPERLAALHTEFEQIHPFIDGNGRTGRLV